MRSMSLTRFPTLKGGRPCWASPRNSPGPLNWRSSSAIRNPSVVSQRIFNRRTASFDLGSATR